MRAHLRDAYASVGTNPAVSQPFEEPHKDDTWLLYHPLEAGWVGFAIRSETVRAVVLPAPNPDKPHWGTEQLLQPFLAEIDAAAQIRVLSMGELVAIAVHALPWDGDVLIASKPVGYGLDIGPRLDERGDLRGPAFLVVEPLSRSPGAGRLPRARAEADVVQRAFQRSGWEVARVGQEEATYAAVVDQLRRSQWLHYAGHGIAGGFAGWDSALPLAGETMLDVRAILALPSAPRAVVLSGCKTGRTDPRFGAGGVHLAAAFLLAGAQFVVAATDDIADTEALAFARAFYEVRPIAETDEGLARFQLAVASFRLHHPSDRAWSDLRVWVP